MYLEIFLADFAVFRVFWGISQKYLNFAGPSTVRNIRSPVLPWSNLINSQQCATKFVPNNLGLVDFAIGPVIFVLNLPDAGKYCFLGEIQIREGL